MHSGTTHAWTTDERPPVTDARILDRRIDGLRHTFRVGIPAERVAAAVDARLLEMGRSVPVPGFRPGRAPLAVLRGRHGQRVRGVVVDRMAIDVARRLINEQRLEPIGRPTIHIDEEHSGSSATVEFSILLEVFPQIEIMPFTGIRLKRLRPPPGDPSLADLSATCLRRQLFDALMECHTFAVPDDMVESEYRRIAAGFEAEVGDAVDTELEPKLRGIAERRIRLALLLTEIGRVHDIHVPRVEVEALVERVAERDPAHEAEIIDYYLDHPTALAELQSPLFEERVVRFLLAKCEIEEVDVSADELRGAMEEP